MSKIKVISTALFVYVIVSASGLNACKAGDGDQSRLGRAPKNTGKSKIEIYASNFNPDRCNYGEWTEEAEYYRHMDYKGFITVSQVLIIVPNRK